MYGCTGAGCCSSCSALMALCPCCSQAGITSVVSQKHDSLISWCVPSLCCALNSLSLHAASLDSCVETLFKSILKSEKTFQREHLYCSLPFSASVLQNGFEGNGQMAWNVYILMKSFTKISLKVHS